MNGFLDLVEYGKARLKEDVPASLSGLTFRMLKKELVKGRKVILSNWENTLNAGQLLYAANDASAGYQIFHAIQVHPTKPNEPVVAHTPFAKNFAAQYPSLTRSSTPKEKRPAQEEEGAPKKRSKSSPLTITPSVKEAFDLFSQGKDIHEIAAAKDIKPSTVESYMISV